MHDVDDMALKLYTCIDVGDNDEECAAVIAVDRRGRQKVTPFGATVDLLLDLALKHGLIRQDHYRTFDPSRTAPAPGWELIVDPPGFVTIDYGPGQRLISTRLQCPDRWLSAATARNAVNLLVVGVAGNAQAFRTGTDVLAELDVAAQRGLLAVGAISFTGRQSPAKEVSANPFEWPVHGVTISGEGGVFALNISSPDKGLISSFPLNPDEVTPLAKALSRAVADNSGPINVSAIVRAVTGRHMPPPEANR